MQNFAKNKTTHNISNENLKSIFGFWRTYATKLIFLFADLVLVQNIYKQIEN